ncbi:hypothetical protein RIF29_40393 [Crotalaria pallida]|uniref:RING-CH-type domain-containing protein n=1 Tax=Crotalaria pallida TaxID=3830 RepID=A0AAN9E4N8_CROPI
MTQDHKQASDSTSVGTANSAASSSDLVQLGCACKDELGIAHIHCAEAWFKLKGNRSCEICGETAKNVSGVADHGFMVEWNERRFIDDDSNSSRMELELQLASSFKLDASRKEVPRTMQCSTATVITALITVTFLHEELHVGRAGVKQCSGVILIVSLCGYSMADAPIIIWICLRLLQTGSSSINIGSDFNLLSLDENPFARETRRASFGSSAKSEPCLHAKRILVVGSPLRKEVDLRSQQKSGQLNLRGRLERAPQINRFKKNKANGSRYKTAICY